MQHTLDYYKKTVQVAVLGGLNVKPGVRRLSASNYARPPKRDLSRQTQIQGGGMWAAVWQNYLVRYCYRIASIIKARSGLVDRKSNVLSDYVYVAKDKAPLAQEIHQGHQGRREVH